MRTLGVRQAEPRASELRGERRARPRDRLTGPREGCDEAVYSTSADCSEMVPGERIGLKLDGGGQCEAE